MIYYLKLITAILQHIGLHTIYVLCHFGAFLGIEAFNFKPSNHNIFSQPCLYQKVYGAVCTPTVHRLTHGFLLTFEAHWSTS